MTLQCIHPYRPLDRTRTGNEDGRRGLLSPLMDLLDRVHRIPLLGVGEADSIPRITASIGINFF